MVNPMAYLQEVNQELRRVSWPSREKTINMTVLVIGVSAVTAVFIAAADFVFQELIAMLIG